MSASNDVFDAINADHQQPQRNMAACIFCKIVRGMGLVVAWHSIYGTHLGPDVLAGEIPSFKLLESDKILAYLDIQPLSKGHAVCPP